MVFTLISCPGKLMVLVMPYARLGARLDSHLKIFCILFNFEICFCLYYLLLVV